MRDVTSSVNNPSISLNNIYLFLPFFAAEAQQSLAAEKERERVASEQLLEVNTRVTTLESQVTSLRQERSKMAAQLEVERSKVEMLEDAKNK